MLFKSSLIGVLSALAATHVTSQSCVQLNDTTLLTFPVEDSFLTFTLEGLTTVAENTVGAVQLPISSTRSFASVAA